MPAVYRRAGVLFGQAKGGCMSTIGDEALLEYIAGINDRLRRLEEHAERVGQQLGVPFGARLAGGAIPPDVVALARANKKIEAIKRYRELTGVDLKEAKAVVDSI
jgi:ribosomal protein L7/L12